MRHVAIWDFDGTLARRATAWSGTLAEVLAERDPARTLAADAIRPSLARGFPWHDHHVLHPELADPAAWWARVETVLARALIAHGVSDGTAAEVAREAHARYVDPSRFALFDDVMPALEELSDDGWQHVILSNHVPELPAIVESLGLRTWITAVVNSAATGAEKPHPEAYRYALAACGPTDDAWMLGDSYAADVEGAERAGLRAILVRTPDHRAARFAPDLATAVTHLRTHCATRIPHASAQ